jgi:hypothetical protein
MLLDLTLDYTGRRPFVCDGRPEDSAVLIVGLTPGTEMKADWRGWWVDERFNKAAFMAAYREAKGLGPGQSLRGARLYIAPGSIACGRSGLPLLASCGNGHRRLIPFRLLKTRDDDRTPLYGRPFKCRTCGNREVALRGALWHIGYRDTRSIAVSGSHQFNLKPRLCAREPSCKASRRFPTGCRYPPRKCPSCCGGFANIVSRFQGSVSR